jgi:hypothetical protein
VKTLLALLLIGISFPSAASDDIWELKYERFRNFEATPDSPLVREMLAQPIEPTYAKAEMARIALSIMRRSEEARLLKDYMERELVAGLLGLPHRKAATVGEAIVQQRAAPTPGSAELRRQAMAAPVSEDHRRGVTAGGSRFLFLGEKHVNLKQEKVDFGFPANAKNSPRDQAHQRLFSSTCYDRGTCNYASHFIQLKSTRDAIANFFHLLAVLAGGALVPWFVVRANAWVPYPVGGMGFGLKRPLWLGLLLAPPVPVLLWFLAGFHGYIRIGYEIFLTPQFVAVSYVVAIASLPPLVWTLRRHGRLSFVRIVVTATSLGIALPYAWMFVIMGWQLFSPTGPRIPTDLAMDAGAYFFILSVAFCLVTWPTRGSGERPPVPTAADAGHSGTIVPLRRRLAWLLALAGVHAWLLAIGSNQLRGLDTSSSVYGGILFTSFLPWHALAWLHLPVPTPDLSSFPHVAGALWCTTVWLAAYWFLAGAMVRVTSRAGAARPQELAAGPAR